MLKLSEYHTPEKVQIFGKDIRKEELKYHRKRTAVTKEFTFDAAHHLHLYEGKCKSLHGHTYKVKITCSAYLNEIGISIDFGDLKKIFQEAVEEKLDHQYLNNVLPPMNTTAENMVVWMWEEIENRLNRQKDYKDRGARLEELVLYETPKSYATMKREWMEEETDGK